jgi:hypothetical protein
MKATKCNVEVEVANKWDVRKRHKFPVCFATSMKMAKRLVSFKQRLEKYVAIPCKAELILFAQDMEEANKEFQFTVPVVSLDATNL